MRTLKPIKGYKAVGNTFAVGEKFRSNSSLLSIVYRNNEYSINEYAGENSIYYAVSISKRNAKKAVVRNRVKRLLRETIRQYLKENNSEFVESIKYIAVSRKIAPQHPKLINLEIVSKDILELLNYAEQKFQKRKYNPQNPKSNIDTAN